MRIEHIVTTYTKMLKNSDKLTKNDVKVVRNKIMHYNIQYDASQVEVLDETQINIYIRIYIYEYRKARTIESIIKTLRLVSCID